MKQKDTTQEYRKQLNRINRYINKWTSQGKVISFKEKPLIKPSVKSVERLKKMTAKELSKRARYVDIETGVIISESLWREQRQERLRESRQKRKDDYVPVYNVYDAVKERILSIKDSRTLVTRSGGVLRISNTALTDMLVGFLDELYSAYGDETDNYLKSVENSLSELISKANDAYYYEDYYPAVTQLANYLKRAPLTQEEANIVSENNEGLGVWM